MTCPKAILKLIQSIDLTSSDNSDLLLRIAKDTTVECQMDAVVGIAKRLDVTSHPLVVKGFCSAAATYSMHLTPFQKGVVREAYLRFTYENEIALNYFSGLRYNRIDIRSHLKPIVVEDWKFAYSQKNAHTWHYYLYLASLGEPGAYEALGRKIEKTLGGNDTTNLLKSLAKLQTDSSRAILRQYAQDQRHADGPDGPAMRIADTVAILLGPSLVANQSPASKTASSIGVHLGINQSWDYLGSTVTVLAINRVVRFRITDASGATMEYSMAPEYSEFISPAISPNGRVLVQVSVSAEDRAYLQLISGATVEPGGVYIQAKDGKAFRFAGITIKPTSTRVKRTISGGHATTSTLEITENGKTESVSISTRRDENGRHRYWGGMGTIRITIINGDQGVGMYHVIVDNQSGSNATSLPVKDISKLKSTPIKLGVSSDREYPHRLGVRFINATVVGEILTTQIELLNAGPATTIVVAGFLKLDLPNEKRLAIDEPKKRPAGPHRISIPARHRITVSASLWLGRYALKDPKQFELSWEFLTWSRPRRQGVVHISVPQDVIQTAPK